jgi:uncharacterized protein
MIHLEIDTDKISQISKKKENENYRFRTFLKGQHDAKVDKLVHRINKEVEAQIDCTLCGNCCKILRPSVTDKEIDTLAKIDDLSREAFIEKFTEREAFESQPYLKDTPCKYLLGKKCSVYDSRPGDCKSFPHIHKSSFNSRTLSMIEYHAICPIVFNVLERLKAEFRFR